MVAATYGLVFGQNVRERAAIVGVFFAWFGGVLWLGAAGDLADTFWLGVPALAFVVGVPLVVLSTVLLSTASGRRRVKAASMAGLIGIQSIRVLGFWFVHLYAAERLPAPFAPLAGWGDILAGVLAVPVAWIALRSPGRSKGVILGWNVIGAVDFVAAVSTGLMSLPGPTRVLMDEPGSAIMNDLPWIIIPGFLVPSLLTLHAVVFYKLSAMENSR